MESLNKADVTLGEGLAQARRLSEKWNVSVYVLDSSATPGLHPGYWTLSLMSFSSNADARAACSWVGRSPGDTCYGREITG